jgi:predicted nucleic acid-binding protein
MKRHVLDTSVVIKWFSEHGESDLASALALRQGIIEGTLAAVVPDLLFYELANALRFNPHFSADDVAQAVQSVNDMGFDIRAVEPAVLERSIDMAFKFNITVYDAYFLSLAQSEGKPLITADYKMAGRMKGSKYLMRLSEF